VTGGSGQNLESRLAAACAASGILILQGGWL